MYHCSFDVMSFQFQVLLRVYGPQPTRLHLPKHHVANASQTTHSSLTLLTRPSPRGRAHHLGREIESLLHQTWSMSGFPSLHLQRSSTLGSRPPSVSTRTGADSQCETMASAARSHSDSLPSSQSHSTPHPIRIPTAHPHFRTRPIAPLPAALTNATWIKAPPRATASRRHFGGAFRLRPRLPPGPRTTRPGPSS